jgi:hypothetical protein
MTSEKKEETIVTDVSETIALFRSAGHEGVIEDLLTQFLMTMRERLKGNVENAKSEETEAGKQTEEKKYEEKTDTSTLAGRGVGHTCSSPGRGAKPDHTSAQESAGRGADHACSSPGRGFKPDHTSAQESAGHGAGHTCSLAGRGAKPAHTSAPSGRGASHAAPKMKIFVRPNPAEGKIMALEVSATDTIESVLARIQNEAGFLAERHRLTFDRKRLATDCALVDYGIQHYSRLDLRKRRKDKSRSRKTEVGADMSDEEDNTFECHLRW